MATRKKPAKKKPLKEAPVSRAPAKKKAPAKKAPARKKPPRTRPLSPRKSSGPRQPPMHATLSRAELVDATGPRDETFEIFKSFDRDGSGSIDRAELSRLLEALGQAVTEDELSVALEVIDVNHSGRISWNEFQAWWSAG